MGERRVYHVFPLKKILGLQIFLRVRECETTILSQNHIPIERAMLRYSRRSQKEKEQEFSVETDYCYFIFCLTYLNIALNAWLSYYLSHLGHHISLLLDDADIRISAKKNPGV